MGSVFYRLSLVVVLIRLKLVEIFPEATGLIDQCHISDGHIKVDDPSMGVTRKMNNFITWFRTKKNKRKVFQYNDNGDEFDLMNA